MKSSLRWGFKTLFVLLSACSRHQAVGPSTVYRLPWPAENGVYQLQNVSLSTLVEPQALRGLDARIIVDPSSSANGIEGPDPIGRYVDADGVRVPADFTTLQAITVYAHLEGLRRLDKKLGVESLLSWPLNVGILVHINEHDRLLENNALYDGILNALLIVPYTASALPITLNAGILAHEHFHSLFYAAVLSAVGEARQNDAFLSQVNESFSLDTNTASSGKAGALPLRSYNLGVLRGFNEGLADFWGWVYTGDTQFMSRSIAKTEERRGLDLKTQPVPAASTLAARLASQSEGDILAEAYLLGTAYARFLHDLVVSMNGPTPTRGQREDMAKKIIESLPVLRQRIQAKVKLELISPRLLFDVLAPRLKGLSDKSCQVAQEFVVSDLAGVVVPEGCAPK